MQRSEAFKNSLPIPIDKISMNDIEKDLRAAETLNGKQDDFDLDSTGDTGTDESAADANLQLDFNNNDLPHDGRQMDFEQQGHPKYTLTDFSRAKMNLEHIKDDLLQSDPLIQEYQPGDEQDLFEQHREGTQQNPQHSRSRDSSIYQTEYNPNENVRDLFKSQGSEDIKNAPPKIDEENFEQASGNNLGHDTLPAGKSSAGNKPYAGKDKTLQDMLRSLDSINGEGDLTGDVPPNAAEKDEQSASDQEREVQVNHGHSEMTTMPTTVKATHRKTGHAKPTRGKVGKHKKKKGKKKMLSEKKSDPDKMKVKGKGKPPSFLKAGDNLPIAANETDDDTLSRMIGWAQENHANMTSFDIVDEGSDRVDIPLTGKSSWHKLIHGRRDMVLAGSVVCGVGIILIVLSIIYMILNRRERLRRNNASNNNLYRRLGTADERAGLRKPQRSLFPVSSSDESEEEDTVFNYMTTRNRK